MKLTKSILMIGLMTVCGYAHAVNVTPQIQRLLNEKQEKMAELEKCEGKKKGFMIAGISTIGLTAGGIALNIVQANKISNLNEDLESKNKELTQKQGELSRLNTQINEKRRNQKIADCARMGKDYDPATDDCKDREKAETPKPVVPERSEDDRGGEDDNNYDDLKITCDNARVSVAVYPGMDQISSRLNSECSALGGTWTSVESRNANGEVIIGAVTYECTNMTKCKDSEKGKKEKVLPTRVLGDDCTKGDLPTGATRGHYIGFGINNLDCIDKSGKSVKCSCAAQVCDESNGYELVKNAQGNSQGRCQKKKQQSDNTTEKVGASTTTSTETTKTAVNQSNNKSKSGLPDVNTDGVGYGHYDIDGDSNYDGGCSVSNPGEWCVKFPDNMVVSGVAVCNNTAGTHAVASNEEQTETGGSNCWCRMTHPAVSRWVFGYSSSSASACSDGCALNCGYYVHLNSNFRSGVFGSVAQ